MMLDDQSNRADASTKSRPPVSHSLLRCHSELIRPAQVRVVIHKRGLKSVATIVTAEGFIVMRTNAFGAPSENGRCLAYSTV